MGRNNQAEQDALIFQLVSLPIGASGLDARKLDTATFFDMVNARFPDQITAERRGGHDGSLLQGVGQFDPTETPTSQWVYGHGLVSTTAAGAETVDGTHYPIAGNGKGVFDHNGTNVAWTGDRLIVEGKEQRAYLPVMRDVPFELVGGKHADVLPFLGNKAVAVAVDTGGLLVVVLDSNGLVTHQQAIGSGEVIRLRLVLAGEIPLLTFIDENGFQVSRWTGSAWNTPSVVESSATVFDVTKDSTGCFFIWDRVSSGEHTIHAGEFHDGVAGSYFTFGSAVDIDGCVPNDFLKLAIAVAPSGHLAYAWTSEGADFGEGSPFNRDPGLYSWMAANDLTTNDSPTQLSSDALYQGEGGHVTVAWRGLNYGVEDWDYTYVVYANPAEQFSAQAADETNTVNAWAVHGDDGVSETLVIHNARLLSSAFAVGQETFVWMKSLTSTTAFLVGGVEMPYRCAVADREETEFVEVGVPLPKTALRHVQETGTYTRQWARPYVTGGYFRRGDIRVGNMDFMPTMSTAKYGAATYVMGSLVRAWDGYELGDAGFHDYPIVTELTEVENLIDGMPVGTYQFRLYPVRYTAAGERMKGVGAVSETITTEALANLLVELATMPLTNHPDVKLEIYMAYAGRTEFRLVDVVENDLTVGHITLNAINLTLDEWLELPADEHAPAVGIAVALEAFGPLGCEVLCTSGDRLWGIGGQVPAGVVQFSKRVEVNQAAGFGDLISTQVMDATGADLTSLASFSDSALVGFKRDGFYTMLGLGPDNFGNGSYEAPNLSVASGAVNHAGTFATPNGVFYWAPEGPRRLTSLNTTEYVGNEVRPLVVEKDGTPILTPTGVRVELDKSEVIWYTDNGAALLLNYAGQQARWSRWTGVPVAGCSPTALVTPNGELWLPSDVELDAGRSFSFSFETGNIRIGRSLQGGHRIKQAGITGKWLGEHRVKLNVFYDGSPDWLERVIWTPGDSSWLVPQTLWADLTPAEIDDLNITDQTGKYDLMARVSRQDCAFVRLKFSDLGHRGFLPQGVTLDLAELPRVARIAAQTIQRNGN